MHLHECIYTLTHVCIYMYMYTYTHIRQLLITWHQSLSNYVFFCGTLLAGAAANRTKQEQEQLATADKTESHPTRGCHYRGPQRGGQWRGLPANEAQRCQRWPSREETGIHERAHKGLTASSWMKPEWAAISICEH